MDPYLIAAFVVAGTGWLALQAPRIIAWRKDVDELTQVVEELALMTEVHAAQTARALVSIQVLAEVLEDMLAGDETPTEPLE